ANFRRNTVEHLAGRARPIRWLRLSGRFRQIHAYDRRRFRQAVPFVNVFAETRFDCVAQIDGQLFGASYQQPQTGELLPFRFSQISAEKGGRRQHDGDLVALNQLRDLFRLERVRVSERANAFKERIKEGDGATETV